MEVKFMDEWKETADAYLENTVHTAGDGRINSRFTLRVQKAAAAHIQKEYEDLYAFFGKPGVVPFLIENGQPAPADNGIEMDNQTITLHEPGLRFLLQWMSVSKDSSE